MSAYREVDLESLQRELQQLRGALARERAENQRLGELVRSYQDLRFDPGNGCLACGGPIETGQLLGGKGILGWHRPPYRTFLGMPRGIEWLKRPRVFGSEEPALSGMRCPSCRRLYLSY